MPVIKCNHNLIRPFEIILEILDLGHFQCLASLWQKNKKIFKEKQSFNATSIDRMEYIKKKKSSYWSEHNEMKTDLVCQWNLVESYVLQDIIQVKTQGKLEGKEQLLKF